MPDTAPESLAVPADADLVPALSVPDPLVSIIVISFNTRAMTLDCLRSVVAETTVPYELIVLDNEILEGWLGRGDRRELPGIRLIASRENLGFARGNNVASAGARGKYVLLLNPDTLVLDHALDRIVAFAERTPEAGIGEDGRCRVTAA